MGSPASTETMPRMRWRPRRPDRSHRTRVPTARMGCQVAPPHGPARPLDAHRTRGEVPEGAAQERREPGCDRGVGEKLHEALDRWRSAVVWEMASIARTIEGQRHTEREDGQESLTTAAPGFRGEERRNRLAPTTPTAKPAPRTLRWGRWARRPFSQEPATMPEISGTKRTRSRAHPTPSG